MPKAKTMTRAAKAAATMTKPAAIRKRYSPRLVMDADDAHFQRPPHGDKVGTHCKCRRPRGVCRIPAAPPCSRGATWAAQSDERRTRGHFENRCKTRCAKAAIAGAAEGRSRS